MGGGLAEDSTEAVDEDDEGLVVVVGAGVAWMPPKLVPVVITTSAVCEAGPATTWVGPETSPLTNSAAAFLPEA